MTRQIILKVGTLWNRSNALTLMKSYLENRTQFVQVNNDASSKREIVCGVPQGSLLGPLLFLLYINDIKHASNFNVRLFADDTLIYLSSKLAFTLESNINNKIGEIQSWLQASKLSINVFKTKYMIISLNLKANCNFKIQLLASALKQVNFY